MKKYNRDKRARYNAQINKHRHTGERCEEGDRARRIHIRIHYDRYNQIEYIPIIYTKTRDNKARTYIGMTNIIRDIFPEIDAPRTQHTHRATATYHKYIPQETNYTRQKPEPDMIDENTRTVKCIIMNDNEEIIYIGMINRTRTVNYTKGTIDIMLHKGKHSMRAYERAINPDRIIHSVTVRDIKAHDVEIYYI